MEQGLIQANIIRQIGNRLSGTPCRIFGSHVKVLVGESVRYPDAFIVCGPRLRGAKIIEDPVIIFEILSPSTALVDRIVKNQEYRDTPSVQRYVMLEQDQQAATVFAHAGYDWLGHVLAGDVSLPLPEIGIDVPLAELYEGVTFPVLEPDD